MLYLNKPIPQHVIYAVGFLGGLSFIFFTVSLTTNSTLAYRLLFFGIICGLIVYFFHRQNHLLEKEAKITKTVDDKFSVARKELIDIFDDVLTKIYSKQQGVSGILKENGTMSSHKVAFNKFRGVVERLKNSEAVSGLDKNWKNYCDTEKYGDGREFVKYNNRKSGNPEGEKEAKDCAIRNIQAIIKFVNKL